MTSTSLLASAMVLPAWIAASTASSAAVPDDAHSTMSTSGCVATAMSPSRSGVDGLRQTGGTQPLHQLAERGGRRHRGDRRTIARDLHGEQRGVLAGRQADDLQPAGIGVHDRQRAPADRSGRAENGDALHAMYLRNR